MSRTIVSWTRFCEWVQGKTVSAEGDSRTQRWTTIAFTDGSVARVYSGSDTKFGETTLEPPMVEIEEAP